MQAQTLDAQSLPDGIQLKSRWLEQLSVRKLPSTSLAVASTPPPPPTIKMVNASSAETVFTVLTILSSVALRLSPLPDFYQVHKLKSAGEVALLPVATLLGSNCVVGMYAYMIDDMFPLLVTNIFGVAVSLGFIWVYHRHAEDRASIYQTCAAVGAVVVAVLIYTILAALGATNQTRSQAATVLGWATIATSLVQFAAPLATVKKVIRTKSSASLPFTMCLLNIINGAMWVVYAAIVSDMFVMSPNIVSVALGVVQVTLWVMYRSSKVQSTTTEASVVIHIGRIPSNASPYGRAFAALETPTEPPRSGGMRTAR